MWRRQARWTCLSLLLSACGGGGAQNSGIHPASESGTRLRARTWVTDDGARWPDVDHFGRQIWVDSQLGVPCTFQQLPNDLLACAPIATFGDPAVSFLPVRGYADAACTQRIAFGPILADGSAFQASRDSACGGQTYAFGIDPQGGNVVASLYKAGQPLEITTFYQRPLDADTCTATPAPAGVVIVPLGSPVEPTDLVAGHVERVDTGHRLSYRQIVAADGTRERIAWYDAVTKLDCTVQVPGDGPARCLPAAETAYFLPEAFGDAACKRPLASVDPADVPAVVRPDASSTGVAASSYFRVGAAATVLYSKENGACVRSNQTPTGFHATEEMPIDAFDVFADVDLSPADARLGVAGRADAEGAIDPAPATTTDRTAQLACALGPASDGTTRCLPAASQKRYPEMTCGSAPFVTPGPADTSRYASGWSGDFCTGGQALYELGDPLGPRSDVYDTDAQGRGCARNPFASGATSLTFLGVGNEVPASSFAEATLIVE